MISACSLSVSRGLGGGMRATIASSTSTTLRPVLALTAMASVGIDADHRLDLALDLLDVGGGQVDLVEHRHHFQPHLDGGVAVGDRLRLDALGRVDHQQRAFAGGQRTADLIGEVDVPGGVDEVELVGLAVARLVRQRHGLRLDGDAALALDRIGVEHLRLHLAVGQAAADLDDAVGKRRLAVIDVRDDGEVADQFHGLRCQLAPPCAAAQAAYRRSGDTNPALSHGTGHRHRPDHAAAPIRPRRRGRTAWSLVVRHGDAQESALIAAPHQQQHRARPAFTFRWRALKSATLPTALLVHPQDDVARPQTRLGRRLAGDIR